MNMTDADILESQPMDINDDDKPSETVTVPTETVATNGNSEPHDHDPSGKVIQVTNVSPGATLQQLATLFGYLGTVTDIRLYPSNEDIQVQVRVCFIKYENNEQCGVAQHLTNTVFIDKPLIVVPIKREELPEEIECQHLINSINAYAALATTGYLPAGFPADETSGTIPGLPPPPVITCSTDPIEIEEIKRTIFVKDIDPSVTSEQLMAFFAGVGEVKYMRISKVIENSDAFRFAFIEFTAHESVPTALQYNGVIFGGNCLSVNHAKSAIVKPESERIASGRNPGRSSRDVVRRPSSVNLRKSRSRSVSRRRSRSRGRASKGRSRSKARSRSRSKSKKRRSRTRSPPRRRSPVRPRKRTRSRTRSPVRRRRRSTSRSRSRSRSKRRISRSRSRSRDRRRKRRSISKSPSRSPRRRKRSRTKSRSPKRKTKKSISKSPDRIKKKRNKDDKREKDKDRSRDKDKEKDKDKDKDREKEKDRKDVSPEKELKNLLDKVYTYEEEKEKEKRKDKDKSTKEKELLKADD